MACPNVFGWISNHVSFRKSESTHIFNNADNVNQMPWFCDPETQWSDPIAKDDIILSKSCQSLQYVGQEYYLQIAVYFEPKIIQHLLQILQILKKPSAE